MKPIMAGSQDRNGELPNRGNWFSKTASERKRRNAERGGVVPTGLILTKKIAFCRPELRSAAAPLLPRRRVIRNFGSRSLEFKISALFPRLRVSSSSGPRALLVFITLPDLSVFIPGISRKNETDYLAGQRRRRDHRDRRRNADPSRTG